MSSIFAFFFEKTLGKGLLWALAGAGLLVWWSFEGAQQRKAGALAERAATSARQQEGVNAELETADRVRADAQRAARGERVRHVRRDPYHDGRGGSAGR